ncbi:TadE family protein [Nocardioides sp. SYSU D00038]|uniref:TadE family protein n=1 Tax=Nocardioides sp. SYSU D00038 TaxID=2812554 RepID=UPI001966EBD9|nr:TadE/TadG family type IV pilus assembly protein [Nocardioides sp. SYSU D00038]
MSGGGKRQQRRTDGGAAAVEFALIVPVLLLLTFGLINYGYMLSYRQGLSQGAAEGARAAAVALPSTTSGAKLTAAVNAVNESLGSYGVSCAATAAGAATSASGALRRDSADVGTCTVTIAACQQTPTASCARVSLVHEYAAHPLIPSVPGVGLVLPDELSYTAAAEVS